MSPHSIIKFNAFGRILDHRYSSKTSSKLKQIVSKLGLRGASHGSLSSFSHTEFNLDWASHELLTREEDAQFASLVCFHVTKIVSLVSRKLASCSGKPDECRIPFSEISGDLRKMLLPAKKILDQGINSPRHLFSFYKLFAVSHDQESFDQAWNEAGLPRPSLIRVNNDNDVFVTLCSLFGSTRFSKDCLELVRDQNDGKIEVFHGASEESNYRNLRSFLLFGAGDRENIFRHSYYAIDASFKFGGYSCPLGKTWCSIHFDHVPRNRRILQGLEDHVKLDEDCFSVEIVSLAWQEELVRTISEVWAGTNCALDVSLDAMAIVHLMEKKNP